MICPTSRTSCAMSTFSSFVIVPSSFHSGTAVLKAYSSMWATLWRAAASAYTTASMSELLASRFPPCSPVHEHSPMAYRRRMLEQPSRFTLMPPHK